MKGMSMTLEQNIRELRKIYGLSQEQVADAIGVNRTTLVAIEKGDRELNSEELGKLADYLGIDIAELVAQELPDYEKYEQMILEVVDYYHKKTNKSLPKTFLAKLLYLIDFSWFYNELKPMSGMKYRKIEYGPVPDQFFRVYEEMARAGKLSVKQTDRGAYWTTLTTRAGEADRRSKLTSKEKETIRKVVKKWKDSNTREIVAFTHGQLPYQISRMEQFIPYELITQEEPEYVY